MSALTIAIVGHTNTGKTSLVRALTHERNFGLVNDAPSTTIDVTTLSLASKEITLNFVDTPGIEDAIGILELLESQGSIIAKTKEAERLEQFTQDPHMLPLFEQEIKIIKQLLHCDLAFYVIDTRLPFLPKFDYELHLLLQAHKPILPILNFLAEGRYINDWKTHLKAHGLHQYIEYDTIILPKKKRLYEQIAIMFPDHYEALQNFIEEMELKEQSRVQAAYGLVSSFYLNLVTLQVKAKTPFSQEAIATKLTELVAAIEQQTLAALLELFHFNQEDIQHLSLALSNTKLDQEFFTSDNLINFSMQFGKGAATGAGLFAGIDALTAFTTLGAATATGAVVGGLTNTLKHYGEQLWDLWKDIEVFCISDHALLNLTARMLFFVDLLNGRSHAAINPMQLDDKTHDEPKLNKLIEKTRYLRAAPEFCEVTNTTMNSKNRLKTQHALQKQFLALQDKLHGDKALK